MKEDVFDRDSLVGVHLEHVSDEHAQLWAERVGQLEGPSDYRLLQIVPFAWRYEASTFEGLSAADDSVEKHSESPDVGLVAQVRPFGENLRTHITWRATEVGQLHVSRRVREAEVD